MLPINSIVANCHTESRDAHTQPSLSREVDTGVSQGVDTSLSRDVDTSVSQGVDTSLSRDVDPGPYTSWFFVKC